MNARSIVEELERAGCALTLEGGCVAVEPAPDDELLEKLRGHKAEVIAILLEREAQAVEIAAEAQTLEPVAAEPEFKIDPLSGRRIYTHWQNPVLSSNAAQWMTKPRTKYPAPRRRLTPHYLR